MLKIFFQKFFYFTSLFCCEIFDFSCKMEYISLLMFK